MQTIIYTLAIATVIVIVLIGGLTWYRLHTDGKELREETPTEF